MDSLKTLLETLSELENIDQKYDMQYDYEEGGDLPQLASVITIDIVTLIRLLELAREDIETDVELHKVAEEVAKLAANTDVITMDEYDSIRHALGAARNDESIDNGELE